MCLLSLVVFKEFISFTNWKLSFNSILCYMILTFCSIWPFLVIYFLFRNRDERQDKGFTEKYGSFFEGTQYWKTHTLFVVFHFLLRRMIFALSLIYLDMEVQLALQMIISLGLLTYYISYQPMRKSFQNRLEVYNELTFLICLCQCFLFTEYVDDVKLRYQIGVLFIVIVVLNIVTNFSIYVIVLIRYCYKKIKKALKKIKQPNSVVQTSEIIKEDPNFSQSYDDNSDRILHSYSDDSRVDSQCDSAISEFERVQTEQILRNKFKATAAFKTNTPSEISAFSRRQTAVSNMSQLKIRPGNAVIGEQFVTQRGNSVMYEDNSFIVTLGFINGHKSQGDWKNIQE
ncbi:UNKNOWN [Stylonychia lemnae]|uniref:TRP C-terminal domain-containing protein n=1 Tax=Stylonychia lemnae TaxID=5949 RepID=A0A077ZMK5_STYLE|nr:UNKNOWN [Stylonychia lemnae]|eukprot:CDW71173.1 UNKNOWN [Stylonychia lemnae]